MKNALFLVAIASAAATSGTRMTAQGTTPVVTVTVVGAFVTATWTAVPGATSYRVDVGTFAGGSDVVSVNAGNALSGSGGLDVGAYFIRVTPFAGSTAGTTSAEVTFNVGTPRPGPPTGFTASVAGSLVTFTWGPPASGGAPTNYVIQAGTVAYATNLTVGVSVGSVTRYTVNATAVGLPAGTYFTRLIASNAAGSSAASDDVPFTIGTSTPGVPTLAGAVVSGNTVTLSWNAPVGGAPVTGYRLEAAYRDPRMLGPITGYTNMPPTQTSLTASGVPNGGFYWRIRALSNAVAGGVFGNAAFYVGAITTPAGPRTPNPRPGQRLSLPSYGAGVTRTVANAYRGDLFNSCVEHGGDNTWLFRLVRELRKFDTRWGLNWKRGDYGDLSQDIVTYNFGALPDEGTLDVYIIDAIGGHCGNNPWDNWEDQTQRTADAGAIGTWTLQPYVAAGFRP